MTTGKFDNIGQLSGLALDILYGPLLQRTQVKRRTYGDMLAELNRRLLAFGGFGEENEVATHWPELLPSDAQGEAQTLQTHQDMGIVSRETIQAKLGYNAETEGPKIAAEKAAAMQAQQSAVSAMPQTMQEDEPPSF